MERWTMRKYKTTKDKREREREREYERRLDQASVHTTKTK